MTAALRAHGPARASAWSLVALALAGAGVAASTWLVLSIDSDSGGVLWPVVVAPIAIALAPIVAPLKAARIGAMVALGGWCVLTGFSIGLLLVPALIASVLAVVKESP